MNIDTQPNTLFEHAINWETSRVQMIEKSSRRAWFVAYSASGLALLSWAAIVLMMPLKEKIPYLLREDTTTGNIDVIGTLSDRNLTYQDVRDKYWLTQYVRNYESFDWMTLQTNYDTVLAYSAKNTAAEYAAIFQGKDALDKKYGQKVKVIVRVLSVVPNGNGVGTVRFTRETKNVEDTAPGEVTNWVATIGYTYRNPATMKESLRSVNPFAFQVTSYRVDPETVTGGR